MIIGEDKSIVKGNIVFYSYYSEVSLTNLEDAEDFHVGVCVVSDEKTLAIQNVWDGNNLEEFSLFYEGKDNTVVKFDIMNPLHFMIFTKSAISDRFDRVKM